MNEQATSSSIHAMTKKYWSGNIRLLSDFFWSLIIALILTIGGANPNGIESTPICFFFFFFWSWNNQHVKKRFARWTIHILCWIVFVLASLMLITAIFDKSRPKDLEMYCLWVVFCVFAIGIAIKYKYIMWPKKQTIQDQING